MARIAGVDLPREKRVEVALTYIFGIGRPTSSRILGETGVSPTPGCAISRTTRSRGSAR